MSKDVIEKSFPKLLNAGYSITSPESVEYNCIAWAVGDTEAWWWPDPQHQYFWPPEIPRIEKPEAFVRAYEMLGYSVCNNAAYEEGYEKIAIYIDTNGKPTHTARQLDSGLWTSKLGSAEDIEHALDGLVGSTYGTIAIILKRSRNQPT